MGRRPELVDEHPITQAPILHAPHFNVMPVPADLSSFPVEMAWHIRYRHDPARRWRRGVVGAVVAALGR